MKKLAAIACLTLLASGAFAQGLVNFQNGTATLVSSAVGVPAAGAAGSYYYGLLTAPYGTTDPKAFTYSGLSAVNFATVAGGINGGNNKTVAGWAAGTTKSFEIAGWSAALGANWNAEWLAGTYAGVPGLFGVSAIGYGVAGGSDTAGTSFPPLPLFGGTGVTAGWVLNVIPVPEPTTMALAGLGAAALLIFRRRN